MGKKVLIIQFYLMCVLFFVHTPSYSQSGWAWQHPYPQGNGIRQGYFIDANTGWVTTAGNLLKTTNGGVNWLIYEYQNNFDLYSSIYFVNEETGWATNGCKIIKSTNGGVNWNIISNQQNVVQYFYHMHFFDTQTAIALGDNGVYKTTNGGYNWDRKCYFNNVGYLGYSSFSFPNNSAGWFCVPDSGKIYKTTNSGETWTIQRSGYTGITLNTVCFPDSSNGYAFGNSGVFLKTTNGGNNWDYSNVLGSSHDIVDCRFINNNTGWICYQKSFSPISGVIQKTTNGGLTWDTVNVPCAVYKFIIIDTSRMFVGGRGLVYTSNGKTWSTILQGLTNTLRCVRFINENTGWAAGGDGNSNSFGVLCRTTDGGNNWTEKTEFPTYKINSVSFINGNSGWIGGDNSFIAKTTNSGNNWINMTCPAIIRVNYLIFRDSTHGWLTGFDNILLNSYLYFSSNGGTDWIQQLNTYRCEITKMYFINNLTGWASAGEGSFQGKVYKTTNGGTNWNEVFYLGNYRLNTLYFLNENIGWTGGQQGVLYKTTNGGTNWGFLSMDSLGEVNNIFFWNEQTGYANATGFYLSTNGGVTWRQRYINSNGVAFLDMDFINSTTGWLVGYYGSILRTTNGGSVFVQNNSFINPHEYNLYQNYPNPFNPSTKIAFDLPQDAKVKLVIYDILGRQIKTLVDNELRTAGKYTIEFNGSHLASGIYFYRLQVEGSKTFTAVKKMVMIK